MHEREVPIEGTDGEPAGVLTFGYGFVGEVGMEKKFSDRQRAQIAADLEREQRQAEAERLAREQDAKERLWFLQQRGHVPRTPIEVATEVHAGWDRKDRREAAKEGSVMVAAPKPDPVPPRPPAEDPVEKARENVRRWRRRRGKSSRSESEPAESSRLTPEEYAERCRAAGSQPDEGHILWLLDRNRPVSLR
jgi:hypothetical protein